MARPRKVMSLVKAFVVSRILGFRQLSSRLECSRSTVARRLKEHGYFSSYNSSGRFLTIPEVAEFDSRGLWVWKGARFSKHGTLKQTVGSFVGSSESGMTQEELAADLGVRCHNVLLDLLSERRLRRQKIGRTQVYFSPDATVRDSQVRLRVAFVTRPQPQRPTARQKIAVLLELVRDPNASRQEIVERCRRAGVSMPIDVVDRIFEIYDLKKKEAL